MNKLTVVMVLITALGLLVGGCAPAATECPPCPECPPVGPTTDLGGREVRVALENAYPPFNSIDDSGEGVGWDYDVARGICERLNCTPVFVETAWDGVFEAMNAGENDVLMSAPTLTFPRSLKVDYSDPFVEYGQVMLIRADDDRPELADEESLAASDAIIGCQIGTTNSIIARKMVGEERVEEYELYDLPITALMSGDIDAVLIDEVGAIGFLGENPGKMRIAFSVTSGEVLALVFPPMSDLLVPFNWAMNQMFMDGTMDQICEKWLLRPCSPQEE
jgi:polar amino acid transport system substrate-binding protein